MIANILFDTQSLKLCQLPPNRLRSSLNIHIYSSLRAAYYYDAKVQKDRESNSCNCNIDSAREWCKEAFGIRRPQSQTGILSGHRHGDRLTAPITQLNSIPWMIEL